jgi:hypothetical protein
MRASVVAPASGGKAIEARHVFPIAGVLAIIVAYDLVQRGRHPAVPPEQPAP